MLDILGNVFGKGSKKNGKDRPGEGGTSSNTEFTVVNQDPVTGHASIGYPTILTDDVSVILSNLVDLLKLFVLKRRFSFVVTPQRSIVC